jgi:hypothetical protein
MKNNRSLWIHSERCRDGEDEYQNSHFEPLPQSENNKVKPDAQPERASRNVATHSSADYFRAVDRNAIDAFLEKWMTAWNEHDLEAVLAPMAEEIRFEHWNGSVVEGKEQIRRAWRQWFTRHGDFRFDVKSKLIDVSGESFTFEWELDWPSPETGFKGKREIRRGVDLISLRGGQIVSKRTYIKTLLTIEGEETVLKV